MKDYMAAKSRKYVFNIKENELFNAATAIILRMDEVTCSSPEKSFRLSVCSFVCSVSKTSHELLKSFLNTTGCISTIINFRN